MAWRSMTASVPSSLDDEIASVLGAGSLGVEIVPAGAGMSDVRVYLGDADDLDAWRARAQRILAAHGISEARARLTIADVADEAWVTRWQASLAPIPLGSRFVVLPHGELSSPPGREPIRLVPGMAFGTGEHPTTRMCAAALEDLVAPGSTWLDLGCGTGILAIVAARLGAERVMALDVDPEAAHVASEVIAANRLTERISVGVGSIADAPSGLNGIVANIQASFFLAEAGTIARTLRPGGLLVMSGFLVGDIPELEAAFASASIDVEEHRIDEPWVCLLARGRVP